MYMFGTCTKKLSCNLIGQFTHRDRPIFQPTILAVRLYTRDKGKGKVLFLIMRQLARDRQYLQTMVLAIGLRDKETERRENKIG